MCLRELLLSKRIAVVSVCKTAFALPARSGAGVHVGYVPGVLVVGRGEQQLPVEAYLYLQEENVHRGVIIILCNKPSLTPAMLLTSWEITLLCW